MFSPALAGAAKSVAQRTALVAADADMATSERLQEREAKLRELYLEEYERYCGSDRSGTMRQEQVGNRAQPHIT